MIGLVMLGSIINSLTRSTLAVAAPTLLKDLNIAAPQYSWIVATFQGAICARFLDAEDKPIREVTIGLNAPRQSQALHPDPNFYIFLCFGQSNMEGGGKIEDADLIVDPRFQVLADFDVPSRGWKKGQWYAAVPPLTRRTRGISLIDYFGRTMVANLPPQIRLGVVKVGVAGTKIELWDTHGYRKYLATADPWKVNIASEYGGKPYAYLVELAKIAQREGVIKGILLHQGESNANDKDWPNKVKVVYDNLMNDLSLVPAAVPLLAGEVVNADQGGEKASANEIIKTLPATLHKTLCRILSGIALQL